MNDLVGVAIAEDLFDLATLVAKNGLNLGGRVINDSPAELHLIRSADPDAGPPIETSLHPDDPRGEKTPAMTGKGGTGAGIGVDITGAADSCGGTSVGVTGTDGLCGGAGGGVGSA